MIVSGKPVILAILTVALAAAGASWWFRYSATHRAARLWGSKGARLIRDAPTVYLMKVPWPEPAGLIGPVPVETDISEARGLTHLRNALLEDRSFDWTKRDAPAPENWSNTVWELRFRDGKGVQIGVIFSNDCRFAAVRDGHSEPRNVVSTDPIAGGLRDFFNEIWTDAAGLQR